MPYGTNLIQKTSNWNRRFGLSNSYFQSTWKTDNTSTGSSNDNQVTLPLESTGTYNFLVDWGDGSTNTITVYNQPEITHTYSTVGTYTIKIKGTFIGLRFNNTGDRLKILTISRWGNLQLGNNNGYFKGCENLNITALDTLQNSTMTDLSYGLMNCANFNGYFKIDTSNVNTMYATFYGNSILNQQLVLNTSSVEDMGFMLNSCPRFNQPVPFNTAKVKYMNNLFEGDTDFDQDISSWNIELVETMAYMLLNATSWSRANYDKALISWASQNVKDEVPFRCSTQYTIGGAAEAARTYLISVCNWDITDGGGA